MIMNTLIFILKNKYSIFNLNEITKFKLISKEFNKSYEWIDNYVLRLFCNKLKINQVKQNKFNKKIKWHNIKSIKFINYINNYIINKCIFLGPKIKTNFKGDKYYRYSLPFQFNQNDIIVKIPTLYGTLEINDNIKWVTIYENNLKKKDIYIEN